MYKFYFGILILLISGCQSIAQPIVRDKPIPPETVIEPPSCDPGYIWKEDSWHWNSRKDVLEWQEGKCMKARKNKLWYQGRWASVAGGWKWIPGYWKKL